ncbi:MAG: GtrA family protein [Ruminococcus sp.]|nr:GtrA family protein [Ruminococcus sp.]
MSEQQQRQPDIFDKLVHLKIFRWFEPFFQKNREMLMYLFFGVMTTVVSFLTAGIAKYLCENAGLGKSAVSNISTVVSWICAVTFAYVTNRIWVFDSKVKGTKGIITEMMSFYGGRIFTLLVEMGMMWLGYSVMGINYWVTKIAANVVVLILNYVISKLFVFKKKDSSV